MLPIPRPSGRRYLINVTDTAPLNKTGNLLQSLMGCKDQERNSKIDGMKGRRLS
jgi:hypothetical protein